LIATAAEDLEVHTADVDLVLPAGQLDAFDDVVLAWLDDLLADPEPVRNA
jgi:hypothetical protein